MFSPIGFSRAFKTKEPLGWKQTTQAEMEPGSNVVPPMKETELIHQSSSAITLLVSPPINLLIIAKQQLTGWGGLGVGVGGGTSAHNEPCCVCRCQAVQHTRGRHFCEGWRPLIWEESVILLPNSTSDRLEESHV